MKVLEKRTRRMQSFKPGVYRHWKGGLYHALFLARGEASKKDYENDVVYISMTTGEIWYRPFDKRDADSWTDMLRVANDDGTFERWIERFTYVGVQPIPGEARADSNE